MQPLSLCFETATRPQLVQLAQDVARAIPIRRLFDAKTPYIICLTGDKDGGKSLFWDEIKSTLLGTDCHADQNYSEDLQSDDRIYEAWDGQHIDTLRPLRIFFCNMESLFLNIEDIRDVKIKIFSQSPKMKTEMGDLLILSNSNLEECDLHIDLRYGGKNHYNNWHRRSVFTIKDPAIQKLGGAPLLGR
jgi:hypothetical protein